MKVSISNVCDFANATPSSRNFIEGERVLNAEHIIFCGKVSVNESGAEFIAFCLQTSSLKNNPHEINGFISSDGKILNSKCSCKAGLSTKCKHSVAVFLYLNRIDIDDLDLVSSTDTKCLWKLPHTKAMEKYIPSPLADHNCLNHRFSNSYAISISEEDRKKIQEFLIEKNKNSALHKHIHGRHEAILEDNNNCLDIDSNQLEAIFGAQPSNIMLNLSTSFPTEPEKHCCKEFLNSVKVDSKSVCQETFNNKAAWNKERQFRVTGSRCYALFTYTKNKSPNWEKKSEQYFFSKDFKKSAAIKHGIKYEAAAREAYENYVNAKVVQIGLVVPEINPWLGYSPDGVLLDDNGKPTKLIEIKCPYNGKSKVIKEVIPTVNYLDKNLKLKERHSYFAQIQLGMSILNVQQTDFIVYASFDNSFVIVTVEINEKFVNEMLMSLKHAYYNFMIHSICVKEGSKE